MKKSSGSRRAHFSGRPAPAVAGPAEVFVFGRNTVREILKHQPSRLLRLLVAEGSHVLDELRSLLAALPDVVIESLPRGQLSEIAGSENHQGVVAFLEPLVSPSLEELATKAKQGSGILIALDEVQDPHNLGAVLRAAEATQAAGIIIPQDRSVQLTPAARKVSVGASELVPVCQVVNLRRALQQLKQLGFWSVGAALSDQSVDLFHFKPNFPLVLVLGSEGNGLRAGILEECDQLVKIPMLGVLDSLNVSQSAAVLLYEFMRHRLEGVK